MSVTVTVKKPEASKIWDALKRADIEVNGVWYVLLSSDARGLFVSSPNGFNQARIEWADINELTIL